MDITVATPFQHGYSLFVIILATLSRQHATNLSCMEFTIPTQPALCTAVVVTHPQRLVFDATGLLDARDTLWGAVPGPRGCQAGARAQEAAAMLVGWLEPIMDKCFRWARPPVCWVNGQRKAGQG